MKRLRTGAAIRIAALILWSAALLTGCASDPTAESPSAGAQRLVTHRIRLEAAVPASRTQLADDGCNMLWSPGDTTGVFVTGGSSFPTINAPFVYTGSEPASGGSFNGEITLAQGPPPIRFTPVIPIQLRSVSSGAGRTSSQALAAGSAAILPRMRSRPLRVSGVWPQRRSNSASSIFRHAAAFMPRGSNTGSNARLRWSGARRFQGQLL